MPHYLVFKLNPQPDPPPDADAATRANMEAAFDHPAHFVQVGTLTDLKATEAVEAVKRSFNGQGIYRAVRFDGAASGVEDFDVGPAEPKLRPRAKKA